MVIIIIIIICLYGVCSLLIIMMMMMMLSSPGWAVRRGGEAPEKGAVAGATWIYAPGLLV